MPLRLDVVVFGFFLLYPFAAVAFSSVFLFSFFVALPTLPLSFLLLLRLLAPFGFCSAQKFRRHLSSFSQPSTPAFPPFLFGQNPFSLAFLPDFCSPKPLQFSFFLFSRPSVFSLGEIRKQWWQIMVK